MNTLEFYQQTYAYDTDNIFATFADYMGADVQGTGLLF
jgi:hypothetical protein